MFRYLIVLFLSFFLSVYACTKAENNAANAESQPQAQQQVSSKAGEPSAVLPATVAGAFYPSDAETLKANIANYLQAAEIPAVDGEIIAAIVPHAGYPYSGPVAAYAYKAIAENIARQKKGNPDAVFVLAFSHRIPYPYVSVYYKGAFETPLGRKPVNEALARQFMQGGNPLSFDEQVFRGEHSAEVQLPFLQTLLPQVPVVPVIFGAQNGPNIEAVAKGLVTVAESNHILVIATTDLSHYQPYDKNNEFDKETVSVLLEGNLRKAAAYVMQHYDRMCGPAPVLAALSFAENQGAKPVLLKHANSGDTSGKKDAVVGYAAIVFVKKNHPSETTAEKVEQVSSKAGEAEYLNEEEKKTLLKIARKSLETYVREKKRYVPEMPSSSRLKENGAAFVTLTENGMLRGCIGQMEATSPLYETIAAMAVAAASQDRRFRPVQPEELDKIHIEISVNTPLVPVAGPDDIILGKHGVVVAEGLRRGVFLPQVATETGWTKDEFLRNLCAEKAGLPPDAYKNGAQLSVFTSIVFEEEK